MQLEVDANPMAPYMALPAAHIRPSPLSFLWQLKDGKYQNWSFTLGVVETWLIQLFTKLLLEQ